MAEFIFNSVRSLSQVFRSQRRKRSSGPTHRLLVAGPDAALPKFYDIWKLCFKDFFMTCDTVSVDTLQHGASSYLAKLPVALNDVFMLIFDLGDEESFQAISAYRETILESKGTDVPLLIVGFNQMSSARIMGPETADCLVTIEWGLPYTETSDEDLDYVFGELVKIIVKQRCSGIMLLEQRQGSKDNKTRHTGGSNYGPRNTC